MEVKEENDNKHEEEWLKLLDCIPNSRVIEAAKDGVKKDIYDTESWKTLLKECKVLPISETRPLIKFFLTKYPTSGKYWKLYAELELKEGNQKETETIFNNNLINIPHLGFWKVYLSFVKQKQDLKSQDGRTQIRQAYEFLLENMGIDFESTSIWKEYIQLLNEIQSQNLSEEGLKVVMIRKAYHKIISRPLNQHDTIWKEYENWETNVNKTIAGKQMKEKSSAYSKARAVCNEFKSITEDIDTSLLSRPPRGELLETQQLLCWGKYIEFEKSNKLELGTVELQERIKFAYNQALLYLRLYPDMWIDVATLHINNNDVLNAGKYFQSGIESNPTSALLHFAFADFLEEKNKTVEAERIYDLLISNNPSTLSFIQKMKFKKRTSNVDASRQVFIAASKVENIGWEIYVALGFMEFYINKNAKIARNIFEFGLKMHNKNSLFLCQYIKFVNLLNEEKNTRSLFETILSDSNSLDNPTLIWDLFLEFEYIYGDLTAIKRVEQRKREALNLNAEDTRFNDLVRQTKFLDLWPTSFAHLSAVGEKLCLLADKSNSSSNTNLTHNSHSNNNNNNNSNTPFNSVPKTEEEDSKYPKPEFTKWMAFNESMAITNIPIGEGVKVGNAILDLLKILPPSHHYHGPVISVEDILRIIKDTPLPEFAKEDIASFDFSGSKRKSPEHEEDDDNDNDDNKDEPQHDDIFKRRRRDNK